MSVIAAARQNNPALADYTDDEIVGKMALMNGLKEGTPQYKQFDSMMRGYDRTLPRAVNDLGVGIGQGLLGTVKAGAALGSMVLPSVNPFDNPVVNYIQNLSDRAGKDKSQGLQNREAAAATNVDVAERTAQSQGAGFMGQLGAGAGAQVGNYVHNPQLAVQDAVSNLPQLLGPALAGRGLQAGAAMLGAGEKLAMRAGIAGGVGAGGVLQASDVGGETYQRLIKAGASPDHAKALAEIAAAKGGAATIAMAALPFGSTIERSLLKGVEGSAVKFGLKGAAQRGAAGLAEGAGEFVEEGYGQYAGNQAVAQQAPGTNLAAGVGSTGVQGFAVAGPMGAISHRGAHPRTETGEIDLTGTSVGPAEHDIPTWARQGLDPLNERSSPFPNAAQQASQQQAQQNGQGTIRVAADGTALPGNWTQDQHDQLNQVRDFNAGIPVLTDQLAPSDGIPVLHDVAPPQPTAPVSPTLADVANPVYTPPVTEPPSYTSLVEPSAPAVADPSGAMPVPSKPVNRGAVLSALAAANTELNKTAVKKDGTLANTRGNAPYAAVLQSKDPVAAIRELHQDGSAPRDELLDSWHKHLTGETVMDYKAKQAAPAQTAPEGTNSAGFVAEPAAQVQAQVDAVKEGRKGVAVLGQEEAAKANLEGLHTGVATDATGATAVVASAQPAVVQQAIARSKQVGLKQAMGEALGLANPTLTADKSARAPAAWEVKRDAKQNKLQEQLRVANENAAARTAAKGVATVQQVDNKTGQVIGEELVTPQDLPNVKPIAGTTPRVVSPEQVIEQRQVGAETALVEKPSKEKSTRYGKKTVEQLIEIADNTKSEKELNASMDEMYRRWAEDESDGADVAAKYLMEGKTTKQFLASKDGKALEARYQASLQAKGEKAGGALGKKFGATFRTSDTSAETGIPVQAAQSVADAMAKGWTNAPTINVVESVQDLPAHLQEQIGTDGVANPKAAYVDGEVWVVAGNHNSVGDIVTSVLHEVTGHHGLRGLLGAKFESTMTSVYHGNPEIRKAADAMMAAEGLDVHTAVEEVLSDAAQTGRIAPTALERVGNVLRQLLRAAGMGRFAAGVSNAEVKELLAAARGFIENGGPAPTPGGKGVFRLGSDAFKQWFGDSKVVDSSGAPLKLFRGLRGAASDTTTMAPRDDYAVFASSSPHVANTYANIHPTRPSDNEVGAVYPIYVKAGKVIEFPVNNGRFDMFAFDRRAKGLLPGEALVARGVYDAGPQAFNNLDPEKLYSYAADTWAFGKGTSIKSATGNNGAYDGSDTDIRYRRGPVESGAQQSAAASDAEIRAQVKGQEISSKLLGTMTLRQIAEQYGKKLPALHDWIDAVMGRASNASRLASRADRVALSWESNVKDKAERKALADVLLRASDAEVELDNVDPKYVADLTAKQKGEYDSLRTKLASMSTEARQARTDALKVLRDQWQYTHDSLTTFINQTVADPGLRSARLEDLKNELGRNRGDYFPFARFGDRIVVAKGAASDGRDVVSFHENEKAANDAVIAHKKAGVKNVVASLKTEYDPQGTQKAGFVGNLHQMIDESVAEPAAKQELHEALQQMFIRTMPEMSGAKSMIRRDNVEGYSRDALRVFADYVTRNARYASHLEFAPTIQAAREAAEQQSRSSDKRTGAVVIGRKDGAAPVVKVVEAGTARLNAVNSLEEQGYKTEFFNATPDTIIEHIKAKLEGVDQSTIDKHTEALKEVTGQAANGIEDMRAAKALYNHMIKLQNIRVEPNALVDAMGKTGHFWFLGFSPSQWATNLLQNPQVGLPHLSAKYGAAKSTVAMLDTARWFTGVRMSKLFTDRNAQFSIEWLKKQADNGDLKGISKDELRMLQTLEDHQALDFTQAMDLARIGQASSNSAHKFLRLGAAGAHHTEVFNRVTFALAAYRLALKSAASVTHDEATRRAENDVFATHYDYTSENAPLLMKGNFSRVVTMFQKYRQHQIYWWAKNMKEAIKNEAPGDRLRASKAMVLMGTTQLVFGGVKALPFIGAIAFLSNLFAGAADDGQPFDFNQWIEDAAKDVMGDTAGEAFAQGIFGAMGMNVATRIGQGGLLLNTGSEKYEKNADDKMRAYLFDLAGPMGSIALGTAKAYAAFGRGDVAGGLAATTPKFISDALKAYQLEQEGIVDHKKNLTIAPAEAFDASDVTMQALGVMPRKVADLKADGAKIRDIDQGLKDKSHQLTNSFVEAWAREDAAGMQEAISRIKDFDQLVGAKYQNSAFLINGQHLEAAVKEYQNRAIRLAITSGSAATQRQMLIASKTGNMNTPVTPESLVSGVQGVRDRGLPGLPRLGR